MSLNSLLIPLFGYLLFLNCHIDALKESQFDSVGYEPSAYHCGDFLNSTLNDEAMQYVYFFNNEFIRLLSLPFQHEKLFPGDSINFEIIQQSLKERTNLWFEHEQWWLSICVLLIAGSAVFTVFYLLYRCFVCCCGRSKKPVSSDQKYDNFKRYILHLVFGIFVIANIFAAAVLILCSQYATHSIEQMPDRVSSCVGDLAIYKTNTQRQIDKLLTDDFNKNSNELLDAFNNTGKDIVKRFKRGISVDVFDDLIAQEKRANQLKNTEIPNLRRLIREAQDIQSTISNGLTKMREEYRNVLEHCEPESTPACSVVGRTFSTLEVKSPALEKLEIPPELDGLLDKTIQLNFQHDLTPIEDYFAKLENRIQEVVDTRQEDAKDRIKEATDTVTAVKNDLDKSINEFNFNTVRDGADQLKEYTEKYHPYIQYAWYGSLVVAAIFSFIALCFLFGLIYGCCGQRSTHYNDDCCVRSTGSKFYCCGISLALIFMFVFATIASVMLIFGANFNNLICDPWKHPMERPDVVSFVDRFFFSDLMSSMGNNGGEENLTLSKVVTKCNEGQSFYVILGLDKKLKLDNGFSDDLNDFLIAAQLPSEFIANISNDLRDVSNKVSSKVVTGAKEFESFVFESIGNSEELIGESKKFDLESLDQQLRGKIASKPYAGSPVVGILDQMKEFTPKGKTLSAKVVELTEALKLVNAHLEQLNRKPESSKVDLAFNNLIDTNSQTRDEAFANATQEHILSMNRTINAFEDYVRVSMATQITSCAPIQKLLTQSHSVVCAHLIDAFNAMWMAMLLSLALFVPMILMATSLQRLYNNVYAYKYTIHEANTEAAFATDDYAMHEARKFSVSSPYATHNYGYQQDIYPPPYLNSNQQRYR